jgi:hypothetical protein
MFLGSQIPFPCKFRKTFHIILGEIMKRNGKNKGSISQQLL